MSSLDSSNPSLSATSSDTENHVKTQPIPSTRSRQPTPKYQLGDTVFVVGDGSSCHEPSKIASIGFNRRRKAHLYDAVPDYNPSLRGLFSFRESDLRKSLWDVGATLTYQTEESLREMRVVQVKFWHGRFCYRMRDNILLAEGAMLTEEWSLEEKEMEDVVRGKLDELGGFEGIANARKWGAKAHISMIHWNTCGHGNA